MELQQLKGNTWYLADETNIGVYLFKDHTCLLIDSGAGETSARKIMNLLKERRITPYGVFNTHAHADHCGGNQYLQEWTGCKIYASALEKVFIENPVLIPTSLFSAAPMRVLKNRFLMPRPANVSDEVTAGRVEIRGKAFECMALPGHTLGHMGVRTPDGVVFIGDSVMTDEMRQRLPIFFLMDVSKQRSSLDCLKIVAGEVFVPSHGIVLNDLRDVLERNVNLLEEFMGQLIDFLQTPMSREEVVAHIIRRYRLPMSSTQYYLLSVSISAFLAELCNLKRINAKVIGENMKFYQAETRSRKP